MPKDYYVLAAVFGISVALLLLLVKRSQIRQAAFALFTAQLLSWPITLLYVLAGFQYNPVRLFAHATEGNFVFAFIFHPAIFVVYYLHYPKQKSFMVRLIYSIALSALPLFVMFLCDLYTNLIDYPQKMVLAASILLLFPVFNLNRLYIDWYFQKAFSPAED